MPSRWRPTQIINDYVTYLEEQAYEEAVDLSLPDSVMIDLLDIPEEEGGGDFGWRGHYR